MREVRESSGRSRFAETGRFLHRDRDFQVPAEEIRERVTDHGSTRQ
jgi:hypothetical protein